MKNALRRILTSVYGFRRWLLRQQWFHSTVLPAIPRPVRWFLRRAYFLPTDLLELVIGERDATIPPKSMIFTGSVDDFKSSGQALVGRLVECGCLIPTSQILDVGSGMGRLAVALTSYLDGARGSYEGLDIVPAGIEWCQENITARHPNFTFTLADVYNKEYLPSGHLKAAEYRFPYASDSFDLVVLNSVFTHMLPAEVENYMGEISRVLRPGGHCYATFSLLDEESRKSMEAGHSDLRFEHHSGPCWVVDHKVPELAAAYEAEYVQDLYERHGLGEGYTVRYGRWSHRPFVDGEPDHVQDVVIGRRR